MRVTALLLAVVIFLPAATVGAQDAPPEPYVVQPGDTWLALSWQFGLPADSLLDRYGSINSQRQPVIGAELLIEDAPGNRHGRLLRPRTGGTVQLAVQYSLSPWTIALANGLSHPYTPLLYHPLFLARGDLPPRELPDGFDSLELSRIPAGPGEALGLRSRLQVARPVKVQLAGLEWNVASHDSRMIALGHTGAFFPPGIHELHIAPEKQPLWTQPLLFLEKSWDFDQVAFAQTFDPEVMRQERERLFELWSRFSPEPIWYRTFRAPIRDHLAISSNYGARRSVNGGPYDTYHEGVDFSAYGGTPVYAPARGVVVLAEELAVRGKAVILDHGWGIYSGFYHLSSIMVKNGDIVDAGSRVGEVGTTGRSTGNHLHWDLIVNGGWVDAQAWLEQGLGTWLREGW